jgi:hypothetical protein
MTVEIDETLGVGLRVVGIGVDDLVRVGCVRGLSGRYAERQGEGDAEAAKEFLAEGVQGWFPPWKRPNERAVRRDKIRNPAAMVKTWQVLWRLKAPTRKIST